MNRLSMICIACAALVIAPRPAAAWETNDDALRILASRLGPDGLLFANLATLVEAAGSPSEKKALADRVPTDVITPIEHLPVDERYVRLAPAERLRLAGALDVWPATVPGLAGVLRVAQRIDEWVGLPIGPVDMDLFAGGVPQRTPQGQQLRDEAVVFLKSTKESVVDRLLQTRPTVSRRLLDAFEGA
ncbi:MAG TPA: hypothetical protein VHU82_14820 [Vicinamibacterales bacterium]|jgi:hypothetical protein|nr:hypothetical protein [Vicinamibacterales bacterium]